MVDNNYTSISISNTWDVVVLSTGLAMQDIPPLNVVLNPSVDIAARKAGLPIKPAVDNEFDQKVRLNIL